MSGNHPALGSFSEKSPTQQPAQPCSPSFFQGKLLRAWWHLYGVSKFSILLFLLDC